jgi:hypothetical protein
MNAYLIEKKKFKLRAHKEGREQIFNSWHRIKRPNRPTYQWINSIHHIDGPAGVKFSWTIPNGIILDRKKCILLGP